MGSKEIAIGFLLFFIATGVISGMVQPLVSGFLSPWLGWAGAYAGALFGAIVSFPVLVLTFWAAHKAHIDGEIPETS